MVLIDGFEEIIKSMGKNDLVHDLEEGEEIAESRRDPFSTNLVERIRDVEPGYNTLIRLEELRNISLRNVLVFQSNVGYTADIYHSFTLKSEGFDLIDTKWINRISLTKPNNSPLLKAKKAAHTAYFGYKITDYGDGEQVRKSNQLHKDSMNASAEYDLFRPSKLANDIRKAELVVLPPSLVDKIKTEIPDARIAILEDGKNQDIQMMVPADQEPNYPRVLVGPHPDETHRGRQKREEPRIDERTIELLFKRGKGRHSGAMDSGWGFLDYDITSASRFEHDKKLDDLFYAHIRPVDINNPMERSSKNVFLPEKSKNFGRGTLCSIFKDQPTNYFGMGGGKHGCGRAKNTFLEDLRTKKNAKVMELYDELWTKPLDTMVEALERQKLVTALKDDESYASKVFEAATAFSRLYEPYLHISNMSYLIGSNILRMSHSASINRDSFYQDFRAISEAYVKEYEEMMRILPELEQSSTKMKKLFAPIDAMVEEGAPLVRTYEFLKEVNEYEPKELSEAETSSLEHHFDPVKRLIAENKPVEKIYAELGKSLSSLSKGYFTRQERKSIQSLFTRTKKAMHILIHGRDETKETDSPKFEDDEDDSGFMDDDDMFFPPPSKHGTRQRRLKAWGYNDDRLNARWVQDSLSSIIYSLPEYVAARRNYDGLHSIFERNIKENGATMFPELEFDKITKSLASNTSKGKKFEKLYKKNLESIIPVRESKHHIEYLNYAGSKLFAYIALADFIREEGWNPVEILPGKDGIVDIKNGYYPLTHGVKDKSEIVRNSTYLDKNQRVEVLEGVNAGGKTVDAKMTSFIVCTGTTIGYVPAESARISFFDRVRFRLKDTGMYERSALVQELDEYTPTLEIPKGLSSFSGLDETYTSTNPEEGEALTYSHTKKKLEDPLARMVITSHHRELQDLLDDPEADGVKFSHFVFERDENGKLEFPYDKRPGVNTEGDYAIPIAENEGVHPAIISRAQKYLERAGN